MYENDTYSYILMYVKYITYNEIAVEVKFGKERKLHFEQYKKDHKLDSAFVITKKDHGRRKVGSIQYLMVPAWALCAGAGLKGIRNY